MLHYCLLFNDSMQMKFIVYFILTTITTYVTWRHSPLLPPCSALLSFKSEFVSTVDLPLHLWESESPPPTLLQLETVSVNFCFFVSSDFWSSTSDFLCNSDSHQLLWPCRQSHQQLNLNTCQKWLLKIQKYYNHDVK